ncbi:MAG TPA: hypothetical protein VGN88_10120 [Phycisphaerae bacterium]
MKNKSKVQQRYEKMTDEEMQQRWREQRPRYIKGLAFFVIAALTLFLANHFQHFEQSVLNVVNVAFQILCVFCVLFGMLTAMSFIYGKAAANQTN